MKNRTTYRKKIAATVGGALLAAGLAGAAPGEARADPSGHVSNEELPQLSAHWMQWALSLPNDVNPQVDETGALCAVGQRGPDGSWLGLFRRHGNPHLHGAGGDHAVLSGHQRFRLQHPRLRAT